ncbi:multiple cyclophane-containing RiPP AmcA [Micromonospora rosaria]|uniref:multiple cyclophane-containing RiPP AmcA n=1 Tax=Micromonospora rosaria TaxID=47874 RepID=UPI0012FB0255|nr:multiple cyclophane-containing RiPP AmcA [Micromonospora rosaria]
MTVYVSSYARTGQPGLPGSLVPAPAVPVAAVDPPLFTYAWRRFFDHRSRLQDHR